MSRRGKKYKSTKKRRDVFTRKKLSTAVSAATLLATSGYVVAQSSIEEVVVTATRRAQAVQDIPYNISTISGDEITRMGATSLTDVVRMVPGLASATVGQRQSINSTLILRGVNANNPGTQSIIQNMTDPAVSTYIGDIPLYFNFKLTDIERVEVLRGPQGTLYGSGSVGGTVRFIFNKPDTEEKIARVSGRFSANDESDEMNYSTDFIGNLPLSDNFAVRVTGGYEQQGGVTDASGLLQLDSTGVPVLGDPTDPDSAGIFLPTQKDTDDFESWYIRASALWDITDNATAVLSLMHQEDDGDGDTLKGITNGADEGPGWDHTERHLAGPAEFETDMVSLEVSVDLGFASLTSATGYSKADQDNAHDVSGLYDAITGLYFGFPNARIAAPSITSTEAEVVTEELRLVSQGDGPWDWVAGFWYKDQEQTAAFDDKFLGFSTWAADPTSSGSLIAQLYGQPTVQAFFAAFYGGDTNADPYIQRRTLKFEEKAVFGELTYHVTDAWQVTAGFRQFWQDFSQDNRIDFSVIGPGFTTDEQTSANFNDHILKVNTSYQINDDHMVYFTWAEGFRHGGANGFPIVGPNAVDASLLIYDQDEATNYEIGAKGFLFDGRARYSAAIYRIDWDEPQLDNFLGPLAVPSVLNGNKARTQGIEFEMNAQWTDNLSMTFGYSYTDAELKSGFAVTGGAQVGNDGERLPGVPKHQISWAANLFQPLNNNSELHYYINGSYRSSINTNFNSTFRDFASLDGFAIVDAGINWNWDKWSIGAFVNNIGNEEALSGVNISRDTFDDTGWVGRPRHYGITASYSFF